MDLIRYIYKGLKAASFKADRRMHKLITRVKFRLNGVVYEKDFMARGIPVINVSMKGKLIIGSRFIFHCGPRYNIIGRQQPLYLIVGAGAVLKIGNNVGISSSAIVCQNRIDIGDNVKIGGNVAIYDSDFHSLNSSDREDFYRDKENVLTRPVFIERNVFIGAHTTILKGVTIGENSIIGAGSLISKSIPPNQVWAGNPARYIRDLNY